MADNLQPLMPVVHDDQVAQGAGPFGFDMSPPEPVQGDVLGSAFRLENAVVGAFDLITRPEYEYDPNHNPLDVIGGTPYEERYLDSFVTSYNEQDTRDRMSRIDREEQDRAVLAEAGPAGFLSAMLAGTADPTILIPIGGWLAPVTKGGKAVNIALRAAEGAAVTGGSVGAQELILQGSQETRTPGESIGAVAAGTLLGGILGGGVGALTRQQADEVGAQLFGSMPATRAEEAEMFDAAVGATSAGAAATADARGSGALKPAFGAEKVFAFQDPSFRTMANRLEAARNVGRDLFETPQTLAENAQGIATTVGGSVETQVKMTTAGLGQAVQDYDVAWLAYWKRNTGKGRLGSMVARGRGDVEAGPGGLTYKNFQLEVSRALRSGDQSPIPEVQQAAESFRKNVFDPLKQAAIEVRLLGENVTPADDVSYLNRVYRREVIAARRPEFQDILVQHFQAGQESAQRSVRAMSKKLEERQFEVEQSQARVQEELERFRLRQIDIRNQVKEGKAGAREADKELKQARQEYEKAARAAERARQRMYRDLLADLKRGRPAGTKAQDIVQFIKSKGGIRLAREDAVGRERFSTSRSAELRDVAAKSRGILRSDGLDPDAMLRLAQDEGYILPTGGLDDLVEGIDLTLKGRPVFSQLDDEVVAATENIRAMAQEIDARGVDLDDLTPEDLARLLGDEGGEVSPAVAKALQDIEKVAARFDGATIRVEDISRLADDLKELAPDLVEMARASREAGRVAQREMADLERSIAGSDEFANLPREELLAATDEVVETILGTNPNRLTTYADLVAGPRGPLKERTLRIPTDLIEDFVVTDPEILARMYTRTMAPDVALTGKFGSIEMEAQIAAINDEAANLARAAETDAERTRIRKAQTDAIRDILHIRDRLRGTAGVPSDPSSLITRTGRAVRNLNYLRLLGGMTLSALPDVFRPVMVYGFGRTFGAPLRGLVSQSPAFKGALKEARLAGTAWDMVLDTRAMALADLTDDFGQGSAFERGLAGATRKFGLVSLMAPWNESLKAFTGVVAQTKLFDLMQKVANGKASKADIEFLAQGGIDQDVAERIWTQYRAHGSSDGGVRFANSNAWDDRFAVQAFRAFLNREVDRVIVTPGMDRPIWMDSETGKLIGQFRSFGIASVQRTLMAGLQQRDAAVLQGVAGMIALGMMSYVAKQAAAGREISNDPRVWITEGIDRSGVLAWVTDINNVSEKATGGRIGLSAITGEQASRYASRNIIGALIGPTAGTVTDIASVTRAMATGEVSGSDVRAVRRLLPAQNIFYVRWLLDQVEGAAGDAVGVEMN